MGANTPADAPGWQVRVVPNKFSVLVPDAKAPEGWEKTSGPFPHAPGFGFHELVIETPRHDADLPDLAPQEMRPLFEAYLARHRALQQQRGVRFILIFRNHGASAGTSLSHPHSQVAALPLVPAVIQQRLDFAAKHFDETGRCVYCDLVQAELAARERVIVESPRFVVCAPFASRTPYEVWIMPKRHQASFVRIDSEELTDLSRVLPETLARLRLGLRDPGYNFVIRSAPCGEEDREDFLWHIQIVPRLTIAAGFEMGTGMAINIVQPERAAASLR